METRPLRLGAPLALVALLMGLLLLSVSDAEGSGSKQTCGEATKFGHQFDVRVGGEPVDCAQALAIIDHPCKIRMKHDWSCFSFREQYPFIVWFPSDELFKGDWSTVIIYKRYPCSEASVSRELFSRPPQGFPSLRQLLADDLIRCDLLAGQTFEEVRRLLGPPAYGTKGRSLTYNIGPERDSFFQIDPELLFVGFRKNGVYRGASIFQG